jgi:hypothetical protein
MVVDDRDRTPRAREAGSTWSAAGAQGALPAADAARAYRQAQAGPGALTPSAILALQRTVGNAAVNRLLRGQVTSAPALARRGRPAQSLPAPSPTPIQRFKLRGTYGTAQEVEFANDEEQPASHGIYKNDGFFYKEIGKSLTGKLYERSKVTGAVAAYRGLHFKKTWGEAKYRKEIALIVKDTPTFSSATYEVAIKIAGREDVSVAELMQAAAIVQADLDRMAKYQDKDKPGNLKKYTHREGGNMPRQPGEDEFFSRSKGRKYLNQLAAALSLYINNQKEFEKNLKQAEAGDFGGLHFIKVPFISTSKSPTEAAKYAKGKVQEEADVRTDGTVGRMYVYVAPLAEMQAIGAVDVVESHPNQIYVCEWRFGEKEVTFNASIPPQFLRGQTLVNGDESEEDAGQKAKAVAESEAAAFGGLKDYTMKIV